MNLEQLICTRLYYQVISIDREISYKKIQGPINFISLSKLTFKASGESSLSRAPKEAFAPSVLVSIKIPD